MPILLQMTFAVSAGLVALGTVVIGFWWLVKPRIEDWLTRELLDPVRRTEHQVSVNGHSSANPTVLDRIREVRTEQERMHGEINAARINAEKAREIAAGVEKIVAHQMDRSEEAQTRIEEGMADLKHDMLKNSDEIKTSHARLAKDNERMTRLEEGLAETSAAITSIAESQKTLWPALQVIAEATPPPHEKKA